MPLTMTLKNVCRESGLSIRMLYKLIAEKKLESTTVGRRRLVIVKSLEELLLGKAQRQRRMEVGNGQGDHASGAADRTPQGYREGVR